MYVIKIYAFHLGKKETFKTCKYLSEKQFKRWFEYHKSFYSGRNLYCVEGFKLNEKGELEPIQEQ